MQRRDLLKLIPASVAALAEYSGTEAAGQVPARATSAQPVVAEVKLHTGTPTLFLNGKPAFGAMCWVSPPSTENWLDAECAAAVAKAGIHAYSFDAGKGYEWVEPKPGCRTVSIFPPSRPATSALSRSIPTPAFICA